MRIPVVLLLLLTFLFPAVLFSQDNAQQEQTPTFRKSVNVVNVFFTVKDKHGALVPDLSKDNFEIFENGKPQRFRADEAIADEASLVLTLTGRVSVFSAEDSTNLICDKVVYLAKPQLLRAIGNVTVKSPRYVISGINEEMAKADFSVIGSPDMFGEANAK